MTEGQDRLERLISRRLDGEIAPGERCELEAMLAESPEAAALLRVHERQDELVRSALCETLGGPVRWMPRISGVQGGPAGTAQRRSDAGRASQTLRWLMPLAVAAAMALAIGAAVRFRIADRWDLGAYRDVGTVTSRATDFQESVATAEETLPGEDVVTGDYPPQVIHREVLGVVGEDGQTIYLLEMDRTRTAVVPVGVDL